MPKIITALGIASLVALPLVSCSSPAASDCTPTTAGSHSKEVKVSGSLGKQPEVTLPSTPFSVKKTERSVAISGDGERVVDGDMASVMYGAYNAASGDPLEIAKGSNWLAADFPIVPIVPGAPVEQNRIYPGIYNSLHCSRVGDRVVSAVPPSELFGWSGEDMSTVGVGATDTVVFVFDILATAAAPTGTPAPPQDQTPAPLPTPAAWMDNVPTVDLAGDTPVVTLSKTDPPAALELKVITEGTGAAVTPNSTVTIDYQGTSWDSGKIFDQSYGSGTPATFPVAGVIPGFAAAMVGQKAGATVIVTVPPKYAYGVDPSKHELGGQTLVFLIQIHDVK